MALRVRYHTTKSTDPNKILCVAAKNIEKFGWTQHSFVDRKTGALCLVGAINAACFGHPVGGPDDSNENWKKIQAAEGLAHARIGASYGSASVWNDRPETTKEDVLKVLKEDC